VSNRVRAALLATIIVSALLLLVATRRAWHASTHLLELKATISGLRARVAPETEHATLTGNMLAQSVMATGARGIEVSNGIASVRQLCGSSKVMSGNSIGLAKPVVTTDDGTPGSLTFTAISLPTGRVELAPISVRGGSIVSLSAASGPAAEFRLGIAAPSKSADLILASSGLVAAVAAPARIQDGANRRCVQSLWLRSDATGLVSTMLDAPTQLVVRFPGDNTSALSPTLRLADVEFGQLDPVTGQLQSTLLMDPEIKLEVAGQWKPLSVSPAEVLVLRSAGNLLAPQSILNKAGGLDLRLEGSVSSVTARTGTTERSLSPGYFAYLANESPLAGLSLFLGVLTGSAGAALGLIKSLREFLAKDGTKSTKEVTDAKN
jgi:hypothetical protein